MISDPIKAGSERRWLDLAALGHDAWNTWADSELMKPMEQRATVDLGGGQIAHTDWAGFKFPGPARFNNTVFRANAFFSRAHFLGEVSFDGSQFADATFQETRFSARASFMNCVFSDPSFFTSAHFDGDAFFNVTQFCRFAHFYDATFNDAVEFSAVRFCDKAGFGNATFAGNARFINTKFSAAVDLAQAKFDGVVRFDGAEFAQPPDLTGSDFKHPPSFLDTVFCFHGAPDAHVHYRRLKRLAVDAHDHQGELDLFALETKARRGHDLHWTHPGDWLELVLSHLYEIASNYGRSVLRPIVALALTFLLAAWQFAVLAGQSGPPWTWVEPTWVAAFMNLLPFAGQSVTARQVMENGLCPQVNAVSDLHCLARLYGIGAVEGVVAVVFLFLLVVGLRNLFRIK